MIKHPATAASSEKTGPAAPKAQSATSLDEPRRGQAVARTGRGWSASCGPAERLLAHGAACLEDAELLAVLMRTGCSGMDAVDLCQNLLARWGSLSQLVAAEPSELASCFGIGQARLAQIMAVAALAERLAASKIHPKEWLSSTDAVRRYLGLRFRGCDREVFSCLFLDSQHRLLQQEELFIGTIDGAAVYPREVVKRCLATRSAAVIFAHNHPSGVAEPSQSDIAITRRLQRALETVDVRVLDHLVVGDPEVVSFAERGLL